VAEVIVIGAGISGLATAFWLQRDGHEVTVLERLNRAGGVIGSTRAGDYLFEQGPNSFLDNEADTLALCDALKLENLLLKQSLRANKRYIFFKGELHEVPAGPGIFRSPLLTPAAKRKLYTEVFRGGNRAVEDESLASFVRRRLGEDVLNNLVTPFVSGVYAGDPEKLSLRATFPILYELERSSGSLVRGMIGKLFQKKDVDKKKKKPRAKNLCSFLDGMQTLIDALTSELGDRLRSGVEVTGVERNDAGFHLAIDGTMETLHCDALVMATPSYVTGKLLSPFLPQTNEYLQGIPYNRLNVAGMSFRREEVEHPCDGFGYLVPRNQGIRILGTIWSSSLFARRAPGGERLFTVMIGGGLDPSAYELSDGDLRHQVLEDLQKTVGLRGEPVTERITRWEKAIPQYPIGHVDYMEKMKQEVDAVPGLFVTGNYINGVAVNDCIRNARETARAVSARYPG
jgi:oxygen-dependent protoporphyrinogen oxidase